MFTKTLLPDTVRAIKLIADFSFVKDSYLAGGTALALQLGHRISVDLDFFTQKEIDEKVISLNLKKLSEFKEEGVSWRTVWGKLGSTKFSIFYYKYPLISKTLPFMNINILDLKDIAAMKIAAVADRGTKRDFIDLYFLSKKYSIEDMLGFYDKKYADLEEKRYHLLRSLDYFVDAENDVMPKMLVSVSWDSIKDFFHTESKRLANTYAF